MTSLPTFFSTGMLSPVISFSSTDAVACGDDAVYGDFFAWLHKYHGAHLDVFDGEFDFFPVEEDACHGWFEFEEFSYGRSGFASYGVFHVFAEEHEGEDAD